MTVNKENIQKWVDALRSGKYKQGSGRLRRPSAGGDGFCCLAVACDVYDENGWDGVRYAGEDAYMPLRVSRWLGLPHQPAVDVGICVGGHHETTNLIALNDTEGYNFQQIADVIEQNFLTGGAA